MVKRKVCGSFCLEQENTLIELSTCANLTPLKRRKLLCESSSTFDNTYNASEKWSPMLNATDGHDMHLHSEMQDEMIDNNLNNYIQNHLNNSSNRHIPWNILSVLFELTSCYAPWSGLVFQESFNILEYAFQKRAESLCLVSYEQDFSPSMDTALLLSSLNDMIPFMESHHTLMSTISVDNPFVHRALIEHNQEISPHPRNYSPIVNHGKNPISNHIGNCFSNHQENNMGNLMGYYTRNHMERKSMDMNHQFFSLHQVRNFNNDHHNLQAMNTTGQLQFQPQFSVSEESRKKIQIPMLSDIRHSILTSLEDYLKVKDVLYNSEKGTSRCVCVKISLKPLYDPKCPISKVDWFQYDSSVGNGRTIANNICHALTQL